MSAPGRADASSPSSPDDLVSFLVIGAGSRGQAYAGALQSLPWCRVAAVAEPIAYKRLAFGRKYVWHGGEEQPGQSFESWQDFLRSEATYQDNAGRSPRKVDGIFVCTLDETHAEIICAFAPFGFHIMCEKPLATTWQDCLKIYRALQPSGSSAPRVVFSIGHVLHYSPHNILLRKLLLEERAIGDILSIEHTEPVGSWHFAHSYVRGNWRKESTSAPSLLTKSCHDIDLLLWLLCSPPSSEPEQEPHLPDRVFSTGAILQFKKSRKPEVAVDATNCLSCPAEPDCIFSAKKIYEEDRLSRGHTAWPVSIVDPEIEDLYNRGKKDAAFATLRRRLGEDYDRGTTPQATIDHRPWFGRCVYEADNDVCDDQFVTMTWHEAGDGKRFAKNAVFHMVANTEAQCERRGRVYGTLGEISYDSHIIRVFNFATKQAKEYHPLQLGGGHGGGDLGLAQGFAEAVKSVKQGSKGVEEAQTSFLGCTLEEVVRSHGMVFAAEEARRGEQVVRWREWWERNTR